MAVGNVSGDGMQATDGVLDPSALLDRLPELIAVIDAAGLIRYVNRRLCEAMGYEKDQLVGSNIFDHVHPDDLAYMAWSWETRQSRPGEVGMRVHARAATPTDPGARSRSWASASSTTPGSAPW